MTISRLRLQLAASFALVFLIGLGAADVALFTGLRRSASDEFTASVTAASQGVAQAIREEAASARRPIAPAAKEVLSEWPADSTAYLVYDAAGVERASRGADDWRAHVPPSSQFPATDRVWDVNLSEEEALRLALTRIAATPDAPALTVLAVRSTAGLEEAEDRLARWLSLSAPLVVLVALIGAYFLARFSLTPLRAMAVRISAIAPDDLDQRLPVRKPADELDALAEQFNQLLERLKSAQAQNRQFLARAAHQLRTPLTVIRGESGLALERARTADEYRDLLKRVALAADQMTHRVNELFLLARAEAGDKPPLTDEIELDGLVLECVDLMRGRAAVLGRKLELGTMDHAEVVGNEPLIREAVLELLENACRHGVASQPIKVATYNGRDARVEVVSSGQRASDDPATGSADGSHMGLAIVRWIAGTHGGKLTHRYTDGTNAYSLELRPAKPSS